jgi:hypothetical protein
MGDSRIRSGPFGGGTVLMFRYGHRLSKDIDIFVPDPQYLGYVTPRLSDTAASLTEEPTEMPGSFVKLQFEEAEVDFVAAPNLTDAAWERCCHLGLGAERAKRHGPGSGARGWRRSTLASCLRQVPVRGVEVVVSGQD